MEIRTHGEAIVVSILGAIGLFLLLAGALFTILFILHSHPFVALTCGFLGCALFMSIMYIALTAGPGPTPEQQQARQPRQETHYHVHLHAAAQLPNSGPPPLAWRVAELAQLEQRNTSIRGGA